MEHTAVLLECAAIVLACAWFVVGRPSKVVVGTAGFAWRGVAYHWAVASARFDLARQAIGVRALPVDDPWCGPQRTWVDMSTLSADEWTRVPEVHRDRWGCKSGPTD